MSKQKITYIKNSFYYTAIPFFRNFLAFFTLPIMTRYLRPSDYGVIALLTMIVTFGGIFCLGINNASFRLYFKYKDDISKLQELFSTNLIFTIFALLLYCPVMVLAFPFLNNYFFKGKLETIWALLAFLQFSLMYINVVNQNIFQNSHQGKRWFFNELYAVIVMVTLQIGLVVTTKFTF